MDSKVILNHIVTFILFLYGNASYPRRIVQDFIDYMRDFTVNIFLPSLKSDIIAILQQNYDNDTTLYEIEQCFRKHGQIFDSIDTEPRRFTYLKTKGFVDYEEIIIGKGFKKQLVGNEDALVPEILYGIQVSLCKTLKLFLEIPGMLIQILDYMDKLSKENDIISNILQGALWKNKYAGKFVDEIVLPLYIYYDDLEVGKPLGSHAGVNKFGAIYACIACLPPHLASKLSSILFSTLFFTEDKKKATTKQFSKNS